MKDVEVIISDNSIRLKDNNRSIVMDKASKSLMDFYSYVVCQNKGDVLDIGFGMGFSAERMYKLADSYSCIEINPQIYQKALIWAEDKPNVNIYFGDWVNIIPELSLGGIRFDGIFMDTHLDFNYEKFEEYAKTISNEGCILSIYNYFTQRDSLSMNEYTFNLDAGNYSVPVKDNHKVNWTVFKNREFIKT